MPAYMRNAIPWDRFECAVFSRPIRYRLPPMSSLQVAFLRGVNVGGKNRLPMAKLAAMFTSAGCSRVETYIQSGNVLFEVPAHRAGSVPARIERDLEAFFGHRIPVVIRTAAELRSVARKNPYLESGVDHRWLHVAFLAARPGAKLVSALDPALS